MTYGEARDQIAAYPEEHCGVRGLYRLEYQSTGGGVADHYGGC